jgi:DNA-binding NtrC family response regulator
VRELQNAIERAVVVGKPPIITVSDLAGLIAQSGPVKAEEVLPLCEIEKRHIQFALDECRGNVSLVAQLLQVDRATVYNKIKKYGLLY